MAATTRLARRLGSLSALLLLAACAADAPELETVEYVDLERFMGDWYVIASIPTFIEDEAYNAVEHYGLNDDGTIATTFTFCDGGFDGDYERHTPVGFVRDEESNAVWGMQFIWPIKADYRIVWLTPDYSQTVIARNKRDYVWIMARTPQIPETDYRRMLEFVGTIGYDVSELRKVPQAPLESRTGEVCDS
jgi:apolipoprotein D and lipocalin family protein